MMAAGFDAIVIGGGTNGLVAAAALGGAGWRVLVLERAEALHRRSEGVEFAPGFRAPLAIDSGWVPTPVQKALGVSAPDRVHPEIPLAVSIEPGHVLELGGDPRRAAEAISRYSPDDAAKWHAFTAQLRRLAGFLEAIYELPAPDIDTSSVRDAWPLLGLGRRFRGLGRKDMTEFLRVMPMSVQQLAEDWFEFAPLRAAVAACGVQDSRQGPISGGTGFVLLHHLVGARAGSLRGRGSWRAGPAAFDSALEATARRHGVEIRTGAEVAHIIVESDATAGVILQDGEQLRAPRVLSSLDPARTLLDMVDPVWIDPDTLLALRNIRFRGCTSFVLFAMDRMPAIPGLENADVRLRGTLSLTPDVMVLERAADDGKYGRVPGQPHIEITAPSLLWPLIAPEGRHVIVARVQYAPFRLRDGGTWDAGRAGTMADAVTAAIERVVPCFSSSVLHRATLTPRDLAERFGLTEGALTHGELALDQILFMRPVPGFGRYATPIDGLFLCGPGTHPGPGVMGGPGWLASRQVLSDHARR